MNRSRAERRMWQRTRRIAASLTLPRPFTPEAFIAALAEQRGRPIEIIPVAMGHSLPCGLLVTTDRADYILCAEGTTAFHRRHILLHEAAHLLCGHDQEPAAESSAARLLMPGLSPTLIRRVLGRTVYSEPQECEAELLASLILHRVARDGARPARTAQGHGDAGWLVGAVDGEEPGHG
ncbi:ParH-like protein [Streptomyces sp. NBC_00872]|uniref:ParH-like protein n=1 Tax=Streptomyces sp. NBC_00872 TaxID=2903686 RepID=UPI003870D805|nr:ParH-like protein [Streptomyces sp. NBC_00872]